MQRLNVLQGSGARTPWCSPTLTASEVLKVSFSRQCGAHAAQCALVLVRALAFQDLGPIDLLLGIRSEPPSVRCSY